MESEKQDYLKIKNEIIALEKRIDSLKKSEANLRNKKDELILDLQKFCSHKHIKKEYASDPFCWGVVPPDQRYVDVCQDCGKKLFKKNV